MIRWMTVTLLISSMILQACSGKREASALAARETPSGLMKISVVLLDPKVSIAKPVLEAAFCEIPVTVPGGQHRAYVEQNGMAVEVGWDKVTERRLAGGKQCLDFKNFSFALRNEVEFTLGGTARLGTANMKKFGLTSGGLELFQSMSSIAVSSSDPEWMKPLYWSVGATWVPGVIKKAPRIKVVERYLKEHPELVSSSTVPVDDGKKLGAG